MGFPVCALTASKAAEVAHIRAWQGPHPHDSLQACADDELDEAVMFERIVAGDVDSNDPVWLGISQEAQHLVVSPTVSCMYTGSHVA